MAKANVEVLRETVDAMVRGDVEALQTYIADDMVLHVPGSNRLSGTYEGKQRFFEDFFGTVMSLSGGTMTIEPHDVLGSSDHAVGVYSFTATRDGKTLQWRQVNVYHVRDGQIREAWVNIHDFEPWNTFWS